MRFLSLFFALSFPLLCSSVSFRQSPSLASLSSSSSRSFATKFSLPGVSNAGKVSDFLIRGAQPDLSGLSELKKLGITTIVDLRSESHHTRDQERTRADSLGIHFVSIPVGGFSTPTSAQLAEFFVLLQDAPPQKIYVHCEFGKDRTGVFIAAYRIAFDYWSADQAISEMRAFGFHSHWHPAMVNFVRALPSRLHTDPILKSALGN